MKNGRQESENRFFNESTNFVPIDIARANKEFSGAGSMMASVTGSVKSGTEGGHIAHLNIYGPGGAEQKMGNTIPTP